MMNLITGIVRRCFLSMLLLVAASLYAAEKPNVILITLDSTRADRMGFLGAKGGLTPHLDALAKQSVVFEHAYAQSPDTLASDAALLTGTYPPYNHVSQFGASLAPSLPYLPQLLRAAGYRTAAFVGTLTLDPRDGFADRRGCRLRRSRTSAGIRGPLCPALKQGTRALIIRPRSPAC